MKTFCLAVFFIFIAQSLFSQHIGYRDNTRKYEADVMVKETPRPKVYKDMCPGRTADLPILNNYVPENVVKTLKQKYMGYLYSITSLKMIENHLKYKVSVCDNGITRTEFVDEAGIIVP